MITALGAGGRAFKSPRPDQRNQKQTFLSRRRTSCGSPPCGKLIYGIPNPEDENQYIGRGDWNLSAKHIFG